MTHFLIKRSPQKLRHTGRRLTEDEVRDQGDASVSQGMLKTATSGQRLLRGRPGRMARAVFKGATQPRA